MGLVIDTDRRIQYAGLYLISRIDEPGTDVNAFIARAEELFSPIQEWLVTRGYVEIDENGQLDVTSTGRDVKTSFVDRHRRYLVDYDVFSAVDLGEGEFAFARYHDFPDAHGWQAYLNQDRFEDLRVAVAEYESVDPIDMIYQTAIDDGSFGPDRTEAWDFDRLLGKVWDDIAHIYNTALKGADLGYEGDGGPSTGREVVEDVVSQGRALAGQLRVDGRRG